MVKKLLFYVCWFVSVMIGLAFFIAFPGLLAFEASNGEGNIFINWEAFFGQFITTLEVLLQPSNWDVLSSWLEDGLMERYTYTLTIFVLSAFIVAILGSIITFSIIMSSYKWRNYLKSILNFFEGIPDLLVIFIFQFIGIMVYRTYQIKLFSLYGFNGKTPYLFPLIIISILPAVFLAQFFIKTMEEEMEKHYILLGQAKGMSRFYVYTVHLFRNIVPIMLIQYRTVFWMILSNIFLVEYMFNIQGYTKDLYKVLSYNTSNNTVSIILSLILFIMPILIFDLLSSFLSKGSIKKGEVNI